MIKMCLFVFHLLVFITSLSPVQATAHSNFQAWLSGVKQEAHNQGISSATLKKAFYQIQPNPRIIKLDRNQPEFKLSWRQYLPKVTNKSFFEKGRKLLKTHSNLLKTISDRYHVQPAVIVALWGMESKFGEDMGGFSVIEALTTLSYDGRRSDFFRKELLSALHIIEQGHITASEMKGSWAGAMGQCQFMPTTFAHYALDFDGDGKKNIWSSPKDALASIAHYLHKIGWNSTQTWGRAVKIPECPSATLKQIMHLSSRDALKIKKPLLEWSKLGVRCRDGSALPTSRPDIQANLLMPDGIKGEAYLVYKNFHVILEWNRSVYFGLAVGTIADVFTKRTPD